MVWYKDGATSHVHQTMVYSQWQSSLGLSQLEESKTFTITEDGFMKLHGILQGDGEAYHNLFHIKIVSETSQCGPLVCQQG